jgi:glycerol-3-phosphate dehydrogenase
MAAPGRTCGSGGAAAATAAIERQPENVATGRYDLIVIGGGIYGVALNLEAARRGYRSLLLERDDYGGATSWASLRIVHGGLRYLQSADLPRFFESVRERRWLLRHFPDLVRPLPCLMPLYDRGLRRPAVLRLALALNDLLSTQRNHGLRSAVRLPRGRIVDPRETAALFPKVDRSGLTGAALWHDAVMLSSERLIMEMLHWACACGSRALNYMEVEGLITEAGGVRGVAARDRVTGRPLRFQADRVVNAAGPWSRNLAERIDKDVPALFRPALAFNLLLDHPPVAEVAVAIEPKHPGSRTYFLLPWKGRIFAGTFHAAAPAGVTAPAVTDEQVARFLEDLNSAVPGLELASRYVLHVYGGLLPAQTEGDAEPARHEVIHDHGAHEGPRGLFSVSGVKFTTARCVAEKTLKLVFAERGVRRTLGVERPPPLVDLEDDTIRKARCLFDEPRTAKRVLAAMVQDEAVINLEDLLLRRIDSTDVVSDREATARRVRSLLTGVGVADARTASADDLRSGTDRRALECCQDIDGPHV